MNQHSLDARSFGRDEIQFHPRFSLSETHRSFRNRNVEALYLAMVK